MTARLRGLAAILGQDVVEQNHRGDRVSKLRVRTVEDVLGRSDEKAAGERRQRSKDSRRQSDHVRRGGVRIMRRQAARSAMPTSVAASRQAKTETHKSARDPDRPATENTRDSIGSAEMRTQSPAWSAAMNIAPAKSVGDERLEECRTHVRPIALTRKRPDVVPEHPERPRPFLLEDDRRRSRAPFAGAEQLVRRRARGTAFC